MAKGAGGRGAWTTTTHDWSVDVDRGHLVAGCALARSLGEAMALHLVLEVVAYADDEAAATGRRGSVVVTVTGREVEVTDDGRGTDTRRDGEGRTVRKPVMASRDVRFFDSDEPPLLPDGLARRGMSVVSAVSPLLLHENWRPEGCWVQAYEHGIPLDELREGTAVDRTGTTVTFRLPSPHVVPVAQLRRLAPAFTHVEVRVGSRNSLDRVRPDSYP